MALFEDREGPPESTRGPVEEVSFSLTATRYPFVGVSDAAGCRVTLENMLPRGGGVFAEIFSVVGADPRRVLELASKSDAVEPSLLAERDDGGLFDFEVSGDCPARFLAELGALPQEVTAEDGEGRIVAETLPGYDAGEVIQEFLAEYPAADLLVKREKEQLTPLFTSRDFERTLDERLTDRQHEVLWAAYEAGYYERPRAKTGEQVAGELEMSSATFSQHIRAAERNLLTILYDA